LLLFPIKISILFRFVMYDVLNMPFYMFVNNITTLFMCVGVYLLGITLFMCVGVYWLGITLFMCVGVYLLGITLFICVGEHT
jgi:hypothetical protein